MSSKNNGRLNTARITEDLSYSLSEESDTGRSDDIENTSDEFESEKPLVQNFAARSRTKHASGGESEEGNSDQEA